MEAFFLFVRECGLLVCEVQGCLNFLVYCLGECPFMSEEFTLQQSGERRRS